MDEKQFPPIANPLEMDCVRHMPTLYYMQAGYQCYADSVPVLVWADSFDTAFELAVDYWDDHAPGVFVNVTDEDLRDAAKDLDIEWCAHWPDYDDAAFVKVVECAECDLTSIGHTTLNSGQYIPSECWTGSEASDEELAHAFRESARAYYAQYGEVPEGYGRWVAPRNRAARKAVSQ